MENQQLQEIKRKKRSLRKYRNNKACIERLENKLALLIDRIETIKSPNISGMPRGGLPVTIDDLLSDKFDLEKRIKKLKDKNIKIKDRILDEIDALEDYRYCEVLESYFIECKSIADIAEDMGYTDRYIYDLYKNAIEELTFNMFE